MPNNLKLESIKTDYSRLLKSLLAAIPHVGPAFTQYMADINTSESRELLNQIKSLSSQEQQQLSSLIQTTNDAFQSLSHLIMENLALQSDRKKIVAVIPVGGFGGSMFPLSTVMPKCLVYINDRTMLQHILNSFVPYQNIFKKVIVIARNFYDMICENIRQGSYGNFVTCLKIDKDLPAALLDIEDQLRSNTFLLHYNDILIPNINWDHVMNRYNEHRDQRNVDCMLFCSTYYKMGIGFITEEDPDILKSFEEKPIYLTHALANMGVALFEPRILDFIKTEDKGIFEDSFIRLINDKRTTAALYRVKEWHHIHELRDLFEIQKQSYP